MKSRIIAIALSAFALAGMSSSVAFAANLRAVRFLSGDATNYANQGGTGMKLQVSYAADYQGYDHVCQMTYSTDGWRTSSSVPAQFSYVSGSSEVWTATASVAGPNGGTFVYSFSCTDLGQSQTLYAQVGAITSYGVTVRDQVRTATAHW